MSTNDEYIILDKLTGSEILCTEAVESKNINVDDDQNIFINQHENDKITPNSDQNKKHVHFPDDNQIVSDYFESKDYWNDHKFCTSEELINSYKNACDRYNIKPIPILMEQLKGIDVLLCHERYDMLNMSNVKIDLKQVECMEEVFKRVQFKTLNFENSNLDDESAASLFEIIEFYESCLKLNISMNSKLSYIGFNACCKMLKKAPGLESIDFKGIMFTESTIPPLNRALRCGSNLKILHMENSNICSKNLLILTSALKMNNHLKELHLSSNRMVPSDGIQLGSLLKVNKHIELLDVRNNSLGDIGLSHICDGLCEQMLILPNNFEEENQDQGLLTLILWSNSITHNGMHALSEALKTHKVLQTLNLGNNPIDSEGIHAIRDGLLLNRSLLRLSLPCCRITCEGGVAIAEYLADTKQLVRLDLRNNDIKTAGLMAISHSMKVNKSIIRLDIDQVSKKDSNVKGYVETQMESLRLINERIQENKKAVIKNEEMKFAHNNESLSISQQSEIEPSSNSTVQLTNSIPDSEIPEITKPVSLPLNLSDPLSILEEPNPTDLSITNTCSEDKDVHISAMSLSLSQDMVTSFDSPSAISNFFSNKVLSPTDTILEFNISEKFHQLGLANRSNQYLFESELMQKDIQLSTNNELNNCEENNAEPLLCNNVTQDAQLSCPDLINIEKPLENYLTYQDEETSLVNNLTNTFNSSLNDKSDNEYLVIRQSEEGGCLTNSDRPNSSTDSVPENNIIIAEQL